MNEPTETAWEWAQWAAGLVATALTGFVAWLASTWWNDRETLTRHSMEIEEIHRDIERLGSDQKELIDTEDGIDTKVTKVMTDIDWIKRTMGGEG